MNTAVTVRQVSATLPGSADGAVGGGRHYRVFLSYSHADTRWANWLLRRLEGFHVPARLHGRDAPIGLVGPRIAPIFRDRDELPSAGDLGETIRTALRESATLVAICSPSAAKSRWVENEILEFKRRHGGAGVFAFIVAGDPAVEGVPADCFSPALRRAVGPEGRANGAPVEIVAADARPHADGRRDALLRLIAGLLGVGFDELRQRELQRRHRRSSLIAAGTTVGMAVTLGLAGLAWQAREDARRRQRHAEDVIGFILGDLRTQLERVGRLDVLEAVSDKAFAHFAALDVRDVSDATLLNVARANTQVGQLRLKQVQYPGAARALLAGYRQARTLTERQPRDRASLYERAQAEFWLGQLCFLRGHWSTARDWWTLYRDSTQALAELDPADRKWRFEALMGSLNLLVLEMERGNHAAARDGFLRELQERIRMVAVQPDDLELQASVGNILSFLGTTAERSGDLPEAIERFGQQIAILEGLVRRDGRTTGWKDKLANSLALQAGVLSVAGRLEAAREQRARARDLRASIRDPANRAQERQWLKLQVDDAMVAAAGGDGAAALRLVEEAREKLEALTRLEPTDRRIASQLATALRVESELKLQAGNDEVAPAVLRALEIGEALLAGERANQVYLGELARTCLLAGTLAERTGGCDAAVRHWQRALEVALSADGDSRHWRLVDPAARALALLGRREESEALIARLGAFGYRPLEPWPEAR